MMKKIILAILLLLPLLFALEWQIETVEKNRPVWSVFSIALDKGGNPWILFGIDSILYLKYKDGTQWKTEVVDDSDYGWVRPAISISRDAIWAPLSLMFIIKKRMAGLRLMWTQDFGDRIWW